MKKNKKNSNTKSPEVVTAAIPAAQKPRKSSIGNAGDILTILFCCLYFIVEFIPNLGATDDQGPQWVYLVLLDMVIAAYFLINQGEYVEAVNQVFRALFSKLFTALFFLAGISVFFS
ncbi:MAG: hypothetical protein ACK5RI_06525, partial [Bacteroidota bacterium]